MLTDEYMLIFSLLLAVGLAEEYKWSFVVNFNISFSIGFSFGVEI
jgi:hypothetical protein